MNGMERKAAHVVVLGAGFGGLTFCQQFQNREAQVTLIDRTNHHVFQPLLYQVAIAMLSPGEVAAPIREILAHQANAEVLMAEVVGIDTAGRRVLLGDNAAPIG